MDIGDVRVARTRANDGFDRTDIVVTTLIAEPAMLCSPRADGRAMIHATGRFCR
jgi:hypothetical protein